MKFKTIAFALPIILLTACSNTNPESSKGFQIKGQLTNSHGETIYLEHLLPKSVKQMDTVKLDDKGEFVMNPPVNEVGFYRLRFSDKNFATFIFNANEKVMIGGDVSDFANTYTVEGSPDSKLFQDVNRASEKNYKKRDSLTKAFQAVVGVITNGHTKLTGKDSLRIDSVSNVFEPPFDELIKDQNKYLKDFIEKNPTSFASLAAIQQLNSEEYLPTYVKLDAAMYAKYPNSEYVKSFHDAVGSLQKLAIGTMAPEITMNTPEGKALSLSSLKGKIVLIDFWASWCGPCRAENPNVVKVYQQYKSKGFDIFSVSLDKDMDKWKAAIKKDNLSWPSHVCDFKFWQSPVVQLYNFNAIPTNVLIDKEGKIIAKNLRGADLEKKLAETFGGK